MSEELNEKSEQGMPEEEFSALLKSISTMAPLFKGLVGKMGAEGHSEHKGKSGCSQREALLVALKPYVSPSRCEAIDYLIRIGRIGDIIRSLQ